MSWLGLAAVNWLGLGLLAAGLITLLGLALSQRAAYRNGFWDGVLWQRERREGRTHPSRPGEDWHGWESLRAGEQQRKEPYDAEGHSSFY